MNRWEILESEKESNAKVLEFLREILRDWDSRSNDDKKLAYSDAIKLISNIM